MKQLLLFLVATTFAIGLSAQQVIWEEDFSDGQYGWTVNTPFCEDYGDPEFGDWTLASGTIDGMAVDLSDGFYKWSFLTPLDYTISFEDDISTASSTHGTVYSRYSMQNDTLISMIDEASVVADGTAFAAQSTNGIVNWATNFDVDDNMSNIMRMIGVGEPTITFTNGGQNFTYTGEDGAVVLEFEKQSECGSFWTWSPNGNVGYNVLSQNAGLVIDSPTRDNGVMVINTLYNNSLGDTNYNPGSPPYNKYVSELISSPIDVSAVPGTLSLEFNQLLRVLNPFTASGPVDADDNVLRTSFAVSTDNGETWSPAIDLNPGAPNNTTISSRVTQPILRSYTEGATEILIKLTWATDFWYWAIDDLALVELAYEMEANDNFYAIPSNVNTPASQMGDVYFMSDIQNSGSLTAENVTLNVTVTSTTGTEVYNEDKLYGSITADSLAENSFFETALSSAVLEEGTYNGTYTLTHDNVADDYDTENNDHQFQFTVTDTLFAKEVGRTRSLAPSGSTSWYMGNSFYVPNGDGWYARYMSFMIDNADDAAAGAGVVTTHLYESDGDVDGNFRIEGDELGGSAIAINEYTFDGTENQQMITIPIDFNEEGVALQDDKYYLLVVQYVGLDENDQVFISASETFNYAANAFMQDSLMMPRYSDVVAVGEDDPSFFSAGFSGTVVPVVRMSIGNNPVLAGDAIVATNDILSADYQMNVFPNPADLEVKLELDMPELLDVNVRLMDQTGRVIMSKDYEKLQHGVFTYDVSQLAAGTYLVQLTTAAGTKTEKVIVSH